jgi:putative FmdB family regulatory protein
MPIYAYRCESCGFAKDVLQKMSDPRLTECPECHKPTFSKQVTAAGFQLKGSGWYVTDFRDGGKGKSDTTTGVTSKSGDAESGATSSSDSKAAGGSGESGGSGTAGSSAAAAPAASASPSAPASAPASTSGSSSSSGTSGS